MASFIDVRNLTKRYGDYLALNDVSVEVAEGEFLALLGPSGCGKTTLLRSIAGFIDNIDGDIFIEGRSMQSLPPNRRPVNTVFQNYALFPHMTVAQNVAYGPRRKGESHREAARLAESSLATVGMLDFKERYPAQLSGGQQQRVALARAIANRPKVLLLDEPLGALDLKLRKQMQIELKTLQQSLGMTFIFVTHDQEEALVMADRIAVMETGRIVQIGSGEEIYHTPATRYVADFIGDANLIACRVAAGGMIVSEGGDISVPARHAAAEGTKVTYLVRPEAISVSAGEPSASDDRTGLRAVVTDIVFVGNATRLYVEAGREKLVCQFASSSGTADFQRGHVVHIGWRLDNGLVLER